MDLGATSTRFYLASGISPVDEERVIISGGGDGVDSRLKRAILQKYPDLMLTDETICQVKEKMGFVTPLSRRCTIELMLRETKRQLDVTDPVHGACESLVVEILEGLQRVLARCPSDYMEKFLENIYLLGGGANLRGLAARVQKEMIHLGLDLACIHTVEEPHSMTSVGALKWALTVEDDRWEIPLFSFESGLC